MAIFKKLVSLLFEESETEVLAEDELKPIDFKEKIDKKSQTLDKEKFMDEYQPAEKIRVEPEVIKPQPTPSNKESANAAQKKFVSIEIEEKKKLEKVVQPEVQPRLVKTEEPKKSYDFGPVISPIFGAKDEVKPAKKSIPIKIKKPLSQKEKNPLGTVISPYYGINELAEFENEAKEKIVAKEKVKQDMKTIELTEVEIAALDKEEETNSIPLEDLISNGAIDEETEDLMQISLFGEVTPIHEESSNYNVKE